MNDSPLQIEKSSGHEQGDASCEDDHLIQAHRRTSLKQQERCDTGHGYIERETKQIVVDTQCFVVTTLEYLTAPSTDGTDGFAARVSFTNEIRRFGNTDRRHRKKETDEVHRYV